MNGAPAKHRHGIHRRSRSCMLALGTFGVLAAGMACAQSPAPAAPSARMTEQLARATAYEHGEGLPKDQRIAAALYCEAARAGSEEAAFRLGWMYSNGRGVTRNDDTASALYQLAAKSGHQYAGAMLARLGGPHGALPDCMRPVEPPPIVAEVAEPADDEVDPFGDLPPGKQKIAELVNKVAPRYGIEPRLALAVISVESNFNVLARSVKDARGLMQLIPETAARFNVRNPYDMLDNVRGGLAYLRWLLAYYKGEVSLAAAAYNAGEGTVDRYRGVPPYPETQAYVRRVLALFRRDRHPYDPKIVEPSLATVQTSAAAR
jgi:soluble lytic murein transglycosylase-like protein